MSENTVVENGTVAEGLVAAKETSGRGRPRKYPYPSTLTCTVTGKTVKTNPTQFAGLMERFGQTQEQVIATYVSREGRQIGKPVKVVKHRQPKVAKVEDAVDPVSVENEAVEQPVS